VELIIQILSAAYAGQIPENHRLHGQKQQHTALRSAEEDRPYQNLENLFRTALPLRPADHAELPTHALPPHPAFHQAVSNVLTQLTADIRYSVTWNRSGHLRRIQAIPRTHGSSISKTAEFITATRTILRQIMMSAV